MICLRDAEFRYPGSERPALSRVNLSFEAGEFSLVCGATGSGKSTLLRILNGLAPHFTGGQLSGSLEIDGVSFVGAKPHELSHLVGFVNQQPESSFVTDTVIEELVFGMEQLGIDTEQMQQRVVEIARMVKIDQLLERPLSWLSGGQQQRVAIAAALAAGQKLILLDEPTSALDPEAAAEIIQLLVDLAHNHGITVILVEHRIERVIELVDSIVVVANDGLVTKGGSELFLSYQLVPPTIELATRAGWRPLPLSPRQAREHWLNSGLRATARTSRIEQSEVAVSVRNLEVRYGDLVAVSNTSFELRHSEVSAIMGPNGSGKSSLLWAIQGLGERQAGEVSTEFGDPIKLSTDERLCVMTLIPQKAADLLFLGSLADELAESDNYLGATDSFTAKIFEQLAGRLDPKLHPRDLSAGQQLALVVALQLSKGAGVVLLDEPTRGLDYAAKKSLVKQIRALAATGKSVLLASHDVEFVAQVADRVIMLDSGSIVSDQDVADALDHRSKNPTQIAQLVQEDGVLTVEDVGISN